MQAGDKRMRGLSLLKGEAMRRMKCKCGSEQFKVHPKQGMVQCLSCGQRFEWKGKWSAMVMSSSRKAIRAVKEAAGVSFDWMQAKVKHPKKEKVFIDSKIKTKKDAEKAAKAMLNTVTKSPDIRKRITDRWYGELILLGVYGKVKFGKHDHKGKLRGVHIARAFHSDLARIGIKTKIRLKDQTGFVEAER